MRRICRQSIILFSLISTSFPIYAQQAGPSELRFPAGTIIAFHLTEAYESCPAGTRLKVKISAAIDSRVNKTGDSVEGVLAVPLTCGNQTILPEATHVMGDFAKLGARNGSQTDSYGIALTFAEAKAGSRSFHAEMDSQQTFARKQPGKPAAQKAGITKDAGLAGNQSRRSAPDPVSALFLEKSLTQAESPHALAVEVTQRGIAFYFSEAIAEFLRAFGATDEVLSALRKARVIYVDSSGTLRTEPARYEADARSLEAKRPDDFATHLLLGSILQSEGKYPEAIQEVRRALVLKPDLGYAHLMLAIMLNNSGQRESEARDSVLRMPDAPEPHIILGLILNGNGDVQGGFAELREAVRISPDYFETHYVLAAKLADQKNSDDAIHEFRETLRLNSSFYPAHFQLGRALYAKPDYDGAAFEFREALRLRPGDVSAHTWLAAALLGAGQFEESAAEARTALLYDPKANGASQFLSDAKTQLSATGGTNGASAPQSAQAAQAASSGGLGGSTWLCHEVQTDSPSSSFDYSITFMDNGIVKKGGMPWGELIGSDATWQLNGSSITIRTADASADMVYEGAIDIANSIRARTVSLYHNQGDFGSLDCNRQTPISVPQTVSSTSQSSTSGSNRPPFDDKCIRMGQGNLGAVTFTNVCTEPVDLKWCYRQHGANGDWKCTVTPRLFPNHTLQSPFCYQCAYDGRAAAYLSSKGLLGSLPSDAEVASWSGSGASQDGSPSGAGNGSVPNDGQRRWRITNPSQNWDTVFLEVRGRSGDSTSDDWSDETPITSFSLRPGAQQLLTCDQWFSLDIRWYTSSSSNPQTDVYYASLVCYANNFVWNNNHNLREYDFPRQ